MKLGVFTVLFQQLSLDQALEKIRAAGLQAIEIGTGGYPGSSHCQPDRLLADDTQLAHFSEAISQHDLNISALSCHANPLHPRAEVARQAHVTFEQTVWLGDRLERDCI